MVDKLKMHKYKANLIFKYNFLKHRKRIVNETEVHTSEGHINRGRCRAALDVAIDLCELSFDFINSLIQKNYVDMATVKHYKPGQIVTIHHRRYRIKKCKDGPRYCPFCDKCAFKSLHEKEHPCYSCLTVNGMLPSGCYFELILK